MLLLLSSLKEEQFLDKGIQLGMAIELCLFLLAAWKCICLYLRGRRARYISSLDPVKDACKIYCALIYVEFPFLSEKALQFALFRTYGIPTISSLLAHTGRLVKSTAKRADDTQILISEFVAHHVDSDRGSYALRRMNLIHSQYDISNQDLLYSLALFVFEPANWASRFAYREFTEAEKLASFVVWHDIGIRMGIKDMPNTIQELKLFYEEYEKKHMVFADTNREVADATLDLLLSTMPARLNSALRKAVYSLLDERILKAFNYPRQSAAIRWLGEGMAKFLLGKWVWFFLPPRPFCMERARICVDWSPNPVCNPNARNLLKYQLYSPVIYKNGYQLSNLGPLSAGKVGIASPGPLLCPLR